MRKNSKKYEMVIKAKNHIVEYCNKNYICCLSPEDITSVIDSCKGGRVLKKYVKHILRCGEFYEDLFYIPSTKVCMETPLKKSDIILKYDNFDDYED